MRREDREAILGEWGPGFTRVRDRREAGVDEHLDGSPLTGKPLRRRLRNFDVGADSYLASLGGPLPYMQRLRTIEDETLAHEQRLAEAYAETARECRGDAALFARRWRERAARWRFDAVNTLIDQHNRYFPIESRLPMDPKTGDFALVNGRPYRREPLDAAWVLSLYPAERAA